MNTPNPGLITSASLEQRWYNKEAVDAIVAGSGGGVGGGGGGGGTGKFVHSVNVLSNDVDDNFAFLMFLDTPTPISNLQTLINTMVPGYYYAASGISMGANVVHVKVNDPRDTLGVRRGRQYAYIYPTNTTFTVTDCVTPI